MQKETDIEKLNAKIAKLTKANKVLRDDNVELANLKTSHSKLISTFRDHDENTQIGILFKLINENIEYGVCCVTDVTLDAYYNELSAKNKSIMVDYKNYVLKSNYKKIYQLEKFESLQSKVDFIKKVLFKIYNSDAVGLRNLLTNNFLDNKYADDLLNVIKKLYGSYNNRLADLENKNAQLTKLLKQAESFHRIPDNGDIKIDIQENSYELYGEIFKNNFNLTDTSADSFMNMLFKMNFYYSKFIENKVYYTNAYNQHIININQCLYDVMKSLDFYYINRDPIKIDFGLLHKLITGYIDTFNNAYGEHIEDIRIGYTGYMLKKILAEISNYNNKLSIKPPVYYVIGSYSSIINILKNISSDVSDYCDTAALFSNYLASVTSNNPEAIYTNQPQIPLGVVTINDLVYLMYKNGLTFNSKQPATLTDVTKESNRLIRHMQNELRFVISGIKIDYEIKD